MHHRLLITFDAEPDATSDAIRSEAFERLTHEHYLAEQQADFEATEPEEDEASLDVHGILEQGRQIAVVWSVEDVLEVRPDLTPDQAWDVLVSCRRRHDATIGINWDVLDCHAEMLFGPAPETDGAGGEP